MANSNDRATHDQSLQLSTEALALYRAMGGLDKSIATTLENSGIVYRKLAQYAKAASKLNEVRAFMLLRVCDTSPVVVVKDFPFIHLSFPLEYGRMQKNKQFTFYASK